VSRKAKYDPLKILPWDEKQVEKFLQKRVPLVEGATEPWTYYADRIKSIRSLSDLSQRPVLLDMIVKTLPVLIANQTPINRPNLYRTYLVGEIKRQRIQKRRTFLISEQDRLSLLQQLAVSVYNGPVQSINFADAKNLIEERIKPPKYELEAHTRDFLTNSFLIRKGDDYQFSHKSIMEYLVAAQLNEEIQTDAPSVFRMIPLQPAVTNFLKEFELDINTLSRWLDVTKEDTSYLQTFLAGNAATLLCALSKDALTGKDLSGAKIYSANLRLANLINTKLTGTRLGTSNLEAARFSKEQLAEATWRNIYVLFLCTSLTEEIRDKLRIVEDKLRTLPHRRPPRRGKRPPILRTRMLKWFIDEEKKVELCAAAVFLHKQEDIDQAWEIFSGQFDEVALYSSEYDRLLKKYPRFNELIHAATTDNV
jgi:hypothetical protein